MVAVVGMGLGVAMMSLGVLFTVGFSLIPLVLALLLDHLLILVIFLYVVLRLSFPTWIPLDSVDWFLAKQVVLIAIPGIFLTRVTTLWVATIAGCSPPAPPAAGG